MSDAMLTPHELELAALVDLLARVGEECASLDKAVAGVKRNALGFAFKLTGHAASALTLLRDKSALVSGGIRFLDRTSVFLLARAGWEAFLLFHWIFVSPGEDDPERHLRYRRWSIESPRRRQHFEIVLDGQAEQMAEEQREIEAALAQIRANPAFLKRSPKEQHEFLRNRGRWRPSFPEMGTAAGVAKIFAEDHYAYLCDHAHSGWFSLESLKGSLTDEEQRLLRETVAASLCIAAAFTISGLQDLFEGLHAPPVVDAQRVARWVAQGQAREE